MDGYLFREGYIRTSSSTFTIDETNVDDKFVHLTNNAIQKYSYTYGTFEDGNQMSFSSFKQYIGDDCFNKVIIPQIKEIIIKSMLAVKNKINPNKQKATFEIFGYDFIIDSDYNVWLIEVNTNPCLEESSALLKMILPRMLDDAFKLTLDRMFPNAKDLKHKKYPVKGYDNNHNMW